MLYWHDSIFRGWKVREQPLQSTPSLSPCCFLHPRSVKAVGVTWAAKHTVLLPKRCHHLPRKPVCSLGAALPQARNPREKTPGPRAPPCDPHMPPRHSRNGEEHPKKHHKCITLCVPSLAFHTQYGQRKPFFLLQELSACETPPPCAHTAHGACTRAAGGHAELQVSTQGWHGPTWTPAAAEHPLPCPLLRNESAKIHPCYTTQFTI